MPVQQDEIAVVCQRMQHGLPVGGVTQRIEVVQQAMIEHQVKGLIRAPCRDVGLHRRHADTGFPGTRLRELQCLGNEIERRDVPAALCQVDGIGPRAAADVERAAWFALHAQLGKKQRGLIVRPGQIPPGLCPVVGG